MSWRCISVFVRLHLIYYNSSLSDPTYFCRSDCDEVCSRTNIVSVHSFELLFKVCVLQMYTRNNLLAYSMTMTTRSRKGLRLWASNECLESIPCHACSKAAGFRQVFCFMWWMTLTLGDKYVVVGFGSVLLLYHWSERILVNAGSLILEIFRGNLITLMILNGSIYFQSVRSSISLTEVLYLLPHQYSN
jgi:hypothetical protein